MQGQVSELARVVKGLQGKRISTDREIKYQHAWVKGELEERAMAAQVEQVKGSVSELASELAAVREQEQRAAAAQVEERMGALEAGLAAQVQHEEESMATVKRWHNKYAIEFQSLRKWAERDAATVAQVEAQMGALEGDLKGLVTGEQLQQVEKRMEKHMEDHMAELASLLALTELKEDAERVWDIQSGALDELNEDAQRLYNQSFGALVEERQSPDGGWYTKQEFNRFFSDDGQTWSECSRAKRGGQLDERAPTREHRIAK